MGANRYNVNAILYMLNYLDNVVNNFGVNAQSLMFYKEQIHNQCAIGQLSIADVEIVERLINLNIADSAQNLSEKWKLELEKRIMFEQCVNKINELRSQGVEHSEQLVINRFAEFNSGKQAKRVISALNKVYDADKHRNTANTNITVSIAATKNNTRNDNYYNVSETHNNKNSNKKTSVELAKIRKEFVGAFVTLITSCGRMSEKLLEVSNLDAICVNDKRFNYYDIPRIISNDKNSSSYVVDTRLLYRIAKEVKHGASVRLVELDPGDGCGYTIRKEYDSRISFRIRNILVDLGKTFDD